MNQPPSSMRLIAALMLVLLAQASVAAAARPKTPHPAPLGSPDQTCSTVRKNPDGSWSPVKPLTLMTPDGPIPLEPAMRFRPGVQYRGFDLAGQFDTICTAQPAGR